MSFANGNRVELNKDYELPDLLEGASGTVTKVLEKKRYNVDFDRKKDGSTMPVVSKNIGEVHLRKA